MHSRGTVSKSIHTTTRLKMSESRIPSRGDVWDAYLDPVVGREQGGRRPVVIVSNDNLNTSPSQLCWIVPLTTRDRGVWAHPPLEISESGLARPSFMLCDQLRSISHDRLRRYRGRVSSESLARAGSVFAIMLAHD
ncbi:MAG: type II toxin-antitoxin system PemK/MazF family toxin [Thermomicrobiales bacterium]